MARSQNHHHNLGPDGSGKCSVPMWVNGVPAGFCDKTAYGKPLPCRTFRDGWTGEVKRMDGRYNGHVPGLACPAHGGPGEAPEAGP